MTGRPKVAILSTWNEICGIAHFTKGIKDNLEKTCDVEVLAMPRSILGNATQAAEIKAANAYCRQLADRVKDFDHINVQFELGVLAPDVATAMRRFKIITEHAKSLSITWHYVARPEITPKRDFLRMLMRGKIRLAAATLRSESALNAKWSGLFKYLREKGKLIKVSHITHTKRDADYVDTVFNRDKYAAKNFDGAPQSVSATPLTYFSEQMRAGIPRCAKQSKLNKRLPKLISSKTRYIGVFGFFAAYKGFETAIEVINLLPPEYELLVFSSVHESALRAKGPESVYPAKLLDIIKTHDEAILKRNTTFVSEALNLLNTLKVHDDIGAQALKAGLEDNTDLQRPLSERVHFLGAVSDDDLTLGMMLCDAVLFPYTQSLNTASGPAAQAVELDRRLFVSRNTQFLELAKFHENRIEFCDIGNAMEYAQKIPRLTADRIDKMVNGYRFVEYPGNDRAHTMDTAIDIYLAVIKP